MGAKSLEQRVAILEAEIAALKARLNGAGKTTKDWLDKICGSFANDPIYEEAMRLGREWRETAGTEPRRRRKKK